MERSVFSEDMYEMILEFIYEDLYAERCDQTWCKTQLVNYSLVCYAWHRTCTLLVNQLLRVESPGSSVPGHLYVQDIRRRLEETPYLAQTVTTCQVIHRTDSQADSYKSFVELFPASLAVHLPHLRSVTLVRGPQAGPLSIHQSLCYTRPVHTVTALEMHTIAVRHAWELDCLLRPYPNIRSLVLQSFAWTPRTSGTGRQEALRVIPQGLYELRIVQEDPSAPTDVSSFTLADGAGIRTILRSFWTVTRLVLDLGTIEILSVDVDRHYSAVFAMHSLRMLVLELFHMFPHKDYIKAYSQKLGKIPILLSRLYSNRLTEVQVHFNRANVVDSSVDDFCELLSGIRAPMERIVRLSHLPGLRTFALYPWRTHWGAAQWRPAVEDCFPLLKMRGMIAVRPHMILR
ncbi:hypothetical protein C8Q80DRAFT_1265751 [Daedaleopsis nitida]|nr:hypothetical protein C8Q80DRAFT_1265751 [Daedaleopsis nitida]